MSYTLNAPSSSLLPSLNRGSRHESAWRRAGLALLRKFEATGQAHARNELHRMAIIWSDVNPEIARQMRQAASELA